MRKKFLFSVAIVVTVGSVFAFTNGAASATFCNPSEGGAGICVKNESEGGFKCEKREYLGDCSGTRWEEVEPEVNP